MNIMKKYVYLASPYTPLNDEHSYEERFKKACAAAAALQMMYYEKYIIFSPIVNSHAIQQYMPEDWNTFDFWVKEIDHHIIVDNTHELWVLMIDGWSKSDGVMYEINLANELNIPIKYVDPDTFEVFCQFRKES